MRTFGVVALAAAAVLSIETVGTAVAASPTTVTLSVDGVGFSVGTAADDVAGLLAEQSVTIDETDLVSPKPSVRLAEGMTVTVDHAAEITVVEQDVETQHFVTSDVVTDVADELSLPMPDFAALTSTSYEPFSYRRTLTFGPAGKLLSPTDRIKDGSRAVVQDVRIAFAQQKKTVDFRVNRKHTELLYQGTKRVKKQGRDGVRKVTARRTFVEGTLRVERVVNRTWVKKPQRKVVRIGTGPNWPALARCESGGNPNAVNPSGYYGLYQFSLSTWRAVGGSGNPTDYGYWEQTYRAWKLYRASGRSPWPHCGTYL
ncbi:MAG TPA: transglycosylase family protein [Actinomycetes bacterium]|nr:transglycosylase family protein [Actinomycetes bacterium]